MNRNRSLFTVVAALALCVVATSAFATRYSDVIASYGTQVQAYWQFAEADSTTYALSTVPAGGTQVSPTGDWMRYLNSGTAQITKRGGPGIVGQGVYINPDGNSSSVSYLQDNAGSASPALSTFKPQDFTVSFWLKPETGGATGATVIPNILLGSSGSLGFQFFSDSVNGGSFMGIDPSGNTPNGRSGAFNPGFLNDEWNFTAITFTQLGADPTKGTMRLYLNGVLKETANIDISGSAPPHNYTDRTAWISFGINADYSGDTGNSTYVDEVAIFNVALTQQQILDQFNAVPEPGMLSLLGLGGAFLVWRRRVAAKRV